MNNFQTHLTLQHYMKIFEPAEAKKDGIEE